MKCRMGQRLADTMTQAHEIDDGAGGIVDADLLAGSRFDC